MNDPQFVEASRMCGERIMKEAGSEPGNRIEFAFKLLIGRYPRTDEKEKMLSLYGEELKAFGQDASRVTNWLGIGEYPVDKSLNSVELAAYSTVASTLMNFDEFVIKR
jgi:hypothetical protein